jgi:hypothetical protein
MSQFENNHVVLWLYTNPKTSKQLKPVIFKALASRLETITKQSHPNKKVLVAIYHVTVDQAYNTPDLLIKGEWALKGKNLHVRVADSGAFFWERDVSESLKKLEADVVCGQFLKHHSWLVLVSDTAGSESNVKPAKQPTGEVEEWMG